MADPVITLRNVGKRFDDTIAIESLSVELNEGEFFALLGPSGCGKTTLLRLLAGFEEPDGGDILLDGVDITRVPANSRPLNMMFQSYALFPHMSVWSNISYGLEMERLRKKEISSRVEAMIETTRLSGLADRKPGQLSGGQRQRVALARALIKRPRVLLLDEPLAALDKKLREEMQLELKRLQHEFGITFVVVTHDQDEALVMADRIALMNNGRIEQISTPHQLYNAPNSRFVAGFIGQSNFIDGRVGEGGLVHETLGLLKGSGADLLEPGQSAVLAVRPERIRVSRSRFSAQDTALEGVIEDVAFLGQTVMVRVSVAGIEQPLVASLPIQQLDDVEFVTGQSIWCLWDANHGRLLANNDEL